MGKTYIVVDLHIGYGWSSDQYSNIWRFQEMVQPADTVIYGGDTLELAWLTSEELLASPAYKRFCHGRRGKSIYVSGNHDPQELWSAGREGYSPDRAIIIKHGHQFDRLADSAWKRCLYRLGPFFRDIWLETPLKQKMHGDNRWQLHNAYAWSLAMQWLEANPYQYLIMGHTHDTVIVERPELNKILIALGSLPEDGIYAEITGTDIIIRNVNEGGYVALCPIADRL